VVIAAIEEMLMIGAAHLWRMIGSRYFAAKDAALEIDRDAAIDRLLGNVGKLGVVAARLTPTCCAGCRCAPAAVRVGDHGLDLGLLVTSASKAIAVPPCGDQCRPFLARI